jgi:divalent metal cation (Fe/Co/Zn/Cd) transporter
MVSAINLTLDQHHHAYVNIYIYINIYTRVYHIGAKYNVEIEIILPGSMTVIDSHDIALELKQKIEAIYEVERVSIHVNYQKEGTLESKIGPPVTYKDKEFNVT